MPKQYYYYYRWWNPGDGCLEEGFYHSTLVTSERPAAFMANIVDREFINEHFVKQFETEAEMEAYWETQHAAAKPSLDTES